MNKQPTTSKSRAFARLSTTTPISGTFSNLANNSTFAAGGNTFKANYAGGTGNDLTLTVQ